VGTDLYAFFLVIPRRLNFIGRCSETSAYKIQMPGNYPEESIQHSEHGESLKSRTELFHADRIDEADSNFSQFSGSAQQLFPAMCQTY